MSEALDINAIVQQFTEKRPTYKRYGQALNSFLKEKLKNVGVEDINIKDRPKEIDSFREKITRPDKDYSDPLRQITDLTGVRIIVCYTDQIAPIIKFLDDTFFVDKKNSIDKSQTLKPDTFGYLSVHYIIYPKENMEDPELWYDFQGLAAEIQIRTNLQDAWATVSHALEYKKESDVPDNLKRKLFRLAGLFELADEQFLNIRNASIERLTEVTRQLQEGKTNELKIDFVSISQFMATSAMMQEALNLANSYKLLGNQEILEHYNRTDYSLVTSECVRLEITTIEQLEFDLKKSNIGAPEFLRQIKEGRVWKASHGFILFLLIIQAMPDKFNAHYLVEQNGWDYTVASHILKVANRIKSKYHY